MTASNADKRSSPRLIVETGRHQSASSPLAFGETTVGAGLDCGIGVSDLGAAEAFRLHRGPASLTLEAAGLAVSIGGRGLRPGQGRTLRRTTTFDCGDVRFRLDVGALASTARPTSWRGGRLSIAGAFGAGALTLAASLHAATVGGSTLGGLLESAFVDPTPTGSTIGPARPKPAPAAPALAAQLLRQSAGADLEAVQIRARPDDAIEATGTVRPDQMERWHEIVRWFDGAAQGRFVLVDQVAASAAAPALQIQAVWPGRNPYVVDGSGQKFFVGSLLPSGWSIQGIDRERVLIKRDAQVVAVRF